jgi:dTDP-glucose pyrophosphorylase
VVTRVTAAVVLAAGQGTRMRAAGDARGLDAAQARVADAGLKAMVPFDRPFLDYALHNLAEAGISRACIVIGPAHDAVREYYEQLPTERLAITCAVQARPLGTADAVMAAREFTGDDHFLVVNGDNVYPVQTCGALCAEPSPGLAAFSRAGLLADGLIPAERLAAFAVVIARDGHLEHIIEKPGEQGLAAFGEDVHVSMNAWVLPRAFYDVVPRMPPSPRGELELPLAAQALVDEGIRFRVVHSDEGVLDLSRRGDITLVGERLRGREVRL